MTHLNRRTEAFTLVELLVVIAIIGILAGFIAVGLPRAIESAKLAKLDNTFIQIRTILTEYLVDHGTYPPAYGYLSPEARGIDPADLQTAIDDNVLDQNIVYFLKPWMAYLEQHSNEELQDAFSEQHDTDRDDDISRLEYSPLGRIANAGSARYNFPNELYDPTIHSPDEDGSDPPNVDDDLFRQFDSRVSRPLLYFPVNTRQFRKLSSDWYRKAQANGNGSDPRPLYSEANPDGVDVLDGMRFPPPSYDAYVLISVGPSANTWKMITDFADENVDSVLNRLDPDNYAPQYYYHILGMAAYFMATRDAEGRGDGDSELDFDFTGRTKRGQAANDDNKLPDVEGRRAFGPVIFVGEG